MDHAHAAVAFVGSAHIGQRRFLGELLAVAAKFDQPDIVGAIIAFDRQPDPAARNLRGIQIILTPLLSISGIPTCPLLKN